MDVPTGAAVDFEMLKTRLIEELVGGHGCHTVLLYGSRARGESTDQSDIDVMGIRKVGNAFRIGRSWHGQLLDAWIYDESNLPNVEDLLYIKDSVILYDRDHFGAALMVNIRKELDTPLKPIPNWDVELRITWIKKMLARAAVGDAEGNYRRHWLLFDLLETWFAFSTQRYHGVKESLKNLEKNDHEMFQLFDEGLNPQAEMEAVTRLANAVMRRGLSLLK